MSRVTSRLLWLALAMGLITPGHGPAFGADKAGKPISLRFTVTAAKGLLTTPQNGRLYVVMAAKAPPEPRFAIGGTGLEGPPTLAHDIREFAPGRIGILDRNSALFPIDDLGHLPVGDYVVQAVFGFNRDFREPNAPGNLYSVPLKIHLDPTQTGTIPLTLTKALPPEQLPAETEYIKYVKVRSDLLSRFYGRPIYLRAGVILPRDFDREPTRRYPLWVHIGGYGSRYTGVQGRMREGSGFRKTWMADDTPRFLFLFLDGAGPLGDPYQVNSANHGPFGDAVTQELIPYVEQKFRAIGQPHARVLDGGSTGGWVSLALQIFYPDFFNGTWSYSPDPVDFRAYQLVDIYKDRNAYVNAHGFERPAAREVNGETLYTMRHECSAENLLGYGDSYTLSGGQWGAWNATYSPRGADGLPIPLWDPKTGSLHSDVAEQWKKYDLRLILEQNWKTLGPKLRGKIHIWVGDADNYFLNNAVHLLDAFLSKADPPYAGSIAYGPGQGHIWVGLTERQIMDQMAAAVAKGPPGK